MHCSAPGVVIKCRYPTGTPGQHPSHQSHTVLSFFSFPDSSFWHLCTSVPPAQSPPPVKSLASVTVSPVVPILLHMH